MTVDSGLSGDEASADTDAGAGVVTYAAPGPVAVTRTDIVGGWTVEPLTGTVPEHVRQAGRIRATVPGCVHTDLLSAGLIPDPYVDGNEHALAWIGLADWGYRTTFEWTPNGSTAQELVFEGLDTVAEVELNGRPLLHGRNMHRTYRQDVTDDLRVGVNELVVRFSSAIRAADRASMQFGYRPHANHHPYNALRKMACSFGWDWGLDTATAGIWRPVWLETWGAGRIREMRVSATVLDGIPTATVDVRIDGDPAALMELDVQVGSVRVGPVQVAQLVTSADGVARVVVPVPDAELWHPVGHGRPALYDLRVTLNARGVELDHRRTRIGFRTVEARAEQDATGVGFRLVVNGETVEVRGANWIPDDAFPHRVDARRYAERLDQAQFAGINLIRVWGGGIYESDDFYAECDERGILVWQDFLFACAAYAEEEPMWSEIGAEARDNIARLAKHPSLVVLNGNNENLWGRQDWGWEKRLDGRTWGEGYYYDLLPRLVAELAPHVAYTPGSPFNPDRDGLQNDPARGTVHIWDLWNSKDWPHYRDYRPRFVSEFGWQGPPTWATLTESVHDDPLTPESPGMLVHQKAIHGNEKLTDGLVAHFPLPQNMPDWHWAMSLNQAVAVRTAIEWFRSLSPHCTGCVVWQLNDCWPVTSWSAVDGRGREKPLLYALRAAYRERLVTIQPVDEGLVVSLLNDTAEQWSGTLVVERHSYDGRVLARYRVAASVDARSSWHIRLNDAVTSPTAPASEVLVAEFAGVAGEWFFADYRDSALVDPEFTVDARLTDGGWDVAIRAKHLAREVTLLVDKLDPAAHCDRALVTLLPGEHVVVHVDGALGADAAAFADRSILRSANDLVVARSLHR